MTASIKKKPARTAAKTAVIQPETLLAEEVRRPSRDLDLYLDWARALAKTAHDHESALIATPMTPEADITAAEIADFDRAVARLTDLQDEQDRRQQATSNLTPTQQRNYAAARAAQKNVVDAIRHAHRDDAAVLGWCAQVLLGVGVADLHDDARKLTSFWGEHADGLARFATAKLALDHMVLLSAQLPDVGTPDAESDKRHTRLRNAAWTLVDRTAARLCTAGKFALRADRDERKRFRRAPRKARRKAAKKG
jgi:hypothetical protein